jgi:hypothetical protein
VDTRRSYYLAHRQDDFGEAPAEARMLASCEILCATPANDNLGDEAIEAYVWKRPRALR